MVLRLVVGTLVGVSTEAGRPGRWLDGFLDVEVGPWHSGRATLTCGVNEFPCNLSTCKPSSGSFLGDKALTLKFRALLTGKASDVHLALG